jgi:hypothetical protein
MLSDELRARAAKQVKSFTEAFLTAKQNGYNVQALSLPSFDNQEDFDRCRPEESGTDFREHNEYVTMILEGLVENGVPAERVLFHYSEFAKWLNGGEISNATRASYGAYLLSEAERKSHEREAVGTSPEQERLLEVQVDCSKRTFEHLRCPCGNWSTLSFDSIEYIAETVQVSGSMPTLTCGRCGRRRVPIATHEAICGLATEALNRGVSRVSVNVLAANGARTRYSYCEKAPLKYSALDTQYIPGLDGQSGFLTPVFFARDALTYFYHHPSYTVKFASDTYGSLWTLDGDYISFGLNRQGKVIMWLGDLDRFPETELKMLAIHNVESDHDIGCEFYEGQIEAVFTELSQEQRVIRAQGELSVEVFSKFNGLKLLQMDAEAAQLVSDLRRPLHFTETQFGDAMETMTKLLIERIDVAAVKKDLAPTLESRDAERLRSLGGLKALELWLLKKAGSENAKELMSPLFVLYDLRVAFKHLIPADKQEATKQSAIERLGLAPDTTLETIYDTVSEKLQLAFEQMKIAVRKQGE